MTDNLTRADSAEIISDGPGSVITLLTDTDALTCNTASFEAGAAGAPVHFHTKATEFFHVTDGRLDVLVGDEIHTLGKGDFLTVPPGVKHAFAPAAGHTAEVFVGFTPGMARFDYYRLLGRVRAGEATVQDIIDSQPVYDNHYAESEAWAGRPRSTEA
ncbi:MULTISPECIES: cupin domain-containing protein [unclassified Streptomyces]|uniref:cupin domain-containing protein n=1 Tax=unclassified Streptomyces TaxID=2593676 RepID=UPI001BE741EC|nr:MULTISPECIES: cupin domain-containing protein [unclassified Streptomyces]MBT2404137.1 cupin domain-containing protein [Streptomyces sp. ISL-21]MBT2458970.1 cupin domain-containing protein [Streptomyces sp. ISL-86]MBT2607153.1 cupin domain-containing protein [Streptomyces sp. ISL-87]